MTCNSLPRSSSTSQRVTIAAGPARFAPSRTASPRRARSACARPPAAVPRPRASSSTRSARRRRAATSRPRRRRPKAMPCSRRATTQAVSRWAPTRSPRRARPDARPRRGAGHRHLNGVAVPAEAGSIRVELTAERPDMDARQQRPRPRRVLAATASGGDAISTPIADLVITERPAKRTIALGETVRYAVRVTDRGPATARNVVVAEQRGDRQAIIAATPARSRCSTERRLPSCLIGTLRRARPQRSRSSLARARPGSSPTAAWSCRRPPRRRCATTWPARPCSSGRRRGSPVERSGARRVVLGHAARRWLFRAAPRRRSPRGPLHDHEVGRPAPAHHGAAAHANAAKAGESYAVNAATFHCSVSSSTLRGAARGMRSRGRAASPRCRGPARGAPRSTTANSAVPLA